MTKKGSFFNQFPKYIQSNPRATLGWLWVATVPFFGSLVLIQTYPALLSIPIDSFLSYFCWMILAGFVMGCALLPTTLTAVLAGYWLGWIGFPWLVLAYGLASALGFGLGKILHLNLQDFIAERFPDFFQKLESKRAKTGSLIFFIRISPVIPFAISNFLFASLSVSLKNVLYYGIPGMLPRTLFAFLAGILASSFLEAQDTLQKPWQIVLLVILFLLSCWGIWKNWTTKKNLAQQI